MSHRTWAITRAHLPPPKIKTWSGKCIRLGTETINERRLRLVPEIVMKKVFDQVEDLELRVMQEGPA
jgi:hypothetical protein